MKKLLAGKQAFLWLIVFPVLRRKPRRASNPRKKQNELPTRKCLSLREKVEVIHVSKELAQSARQLAKRFGCGKTQIAQILARKDTILEEWTSNGTGSHKRSNNEKFEKINHLLWEWYIKARGANIPVDGPLLKEEARLIAEQLGETSFKGTDGWLAKWKKRHNIALLNIAGEEGDVSQETVESWSERVKELTRGFAPRTRQGHSGKLCPQHHSQKKESAVKEERMPNKELPPPSL